MQVYKRGKTWTYRVWITNKYGKRVSSSQGGFKTKQEATTTGLEIALKAKQSGISKRENTTFHDYYVYWINTYKIGRLDITSERKYKLIDKLIEKQFGNTLLKDISRTEYQKMIDTYAENHARKTVNEVNGRIRKVVQGAIDERIIYSDFTRNIFISGLASKSSNLKYIEENQAQKLKEMCLDSASMIAITNYEIVFGLLTGCRIGEVMGLTWDCVDFKNKNVNINKSYDYVNYTGFKPTKTVSSIRVISIPNDLVAMLKKLKAEQSELFIKQGDRDPENLVFRNADHKISSDNGVNHNLKNKLKKIKGATPITFHGLRHTHDSILISNGVDISYISERLGHKDITITLRVYSHLLKKAKIEQNNKAMKVLSSQL
ncbi:site-specific integrase [Companilactobacillus mishanensis]|uniref:Site-specific integrase n=1 Tax=Companilactobacillus mishanensis TaxID=2486008 RepID=A0ABW9P629_9LACO|nr:site-specific integrase [Companilactobacillus mishanensis]MQS44522.1 site-specific integrase [Companilactobacillus mishanensis]